MSLELTSQTDEKSQLSYKQIVADKVETTRSGSTNSSGTQEGRSDRALESIGASRKVSNQKASIAYTLTFSVPILNRTPINPTGGC